MTNQVNQEFEKWWHSSKYMQVVFSDNRTKRVALDGYEAATQASESEINTLKQRMEQLQADNLRLREALDIARDYQFYATQQFHIDFEGYKKDEHAQYDADLANTDNALSSTPAQSLAEHDNETIERIATMLENAEGELKTLSEYIALVRKMKHE